MITNIINWIIENRDWVFSGIGVTILVNALWCVYHDKVSLRISFIKS